MKAVAEEEEGRAEAKEATGGEAVAWGKVVESTDKKSEGKLAKEK